MSRHLRLSLTGSFLVLCLCMAAGRNLQAQVPTHESLRDSEIIALDQAYARGAHGDNSIEQGLNSGQLSLVKLKVQFPGGNPFPDGRLPDLHFISTKTGNMASPGVAEKGSDYAVYQVVASKGSSYTLQWLFYLGGKQNWGTLQVPADAPRNMSAQIVYRAPQPPANPHAGKPCNPNLPNYEQKGCVH